MFKLLRKKENKAHEPTTPNAQPNNAGSDRSSLTRRPALKLDVKVGRGLARLLPSSANVERSGRMACPETRRTQSAELEQSISRIGSLFRRDTTASTRSHDANPLPEEDDDVDSITRIRHFSGITSHSPTVVTPDRSSAGGSSHYEAGVIPGVEFAGHSEDEESIISEYSHYSSVIDESSPTFQPKQQSPHDYLKVSIPNGDLHSPADPYEMSWGHRP